MRSRLSSEGSASSTVQRSTQECVALVVVTSLLHSLGCLQITILVQPIVALCCYGPLTLSEYGSLPRYVC